MRAIYRLGWLCVIAAVVTMTISPSVKAEDEPKFVLLNWSTHSVESASEVGILPVEKNKPLLFTRIIPDNSFKSTVEITNGPMKLTSGGDSIPIGATLVRTVNHPERYCEPMRRRKQTAIYCVADTNDDQELDTLYNIPLYLTRESKQFYSEFLTDTRRFYVESPLLTTVPKSSLMPEAKPNPLDVMFTKKGKTRFALCITRYTGSAWLDGYGTVAFCAQEWDFKNKVFPVTLHAYGGSITVSKSVSGQLQAQIVHPPVQTITVNQE